MSPITGRGGVLGQGTKNYLYDFISDNLLFQSVLNLLRDHREKTNQCFIVVSQCVLQLLVHLSPCDINSRWYWAYEGLLCSLAHIFRA